MSELVAARHRRDRCGPVVRATRGTPRGLGGVFFAFWPRPSARGSCPAKRTRLAPVPRSCWLRTRQRASTAMATIWSFRWNQRPGAETWGRGVMVAAFRGTAAGRRRGQRGGTVPPFSGPFNANRFASAEYRSGCCAASSACLPPLQATLPHRLAVVGRATQSVLYRMTLVISAAG